MPKPPATVAPADSDAPEPVAEAVPVIKQSAVSATAAKDAQAAKLAAIAEAGKFRSTGRNLTGGAWVSGWCGSGEVCRDGKDDPNSGSPRYRCLGIGENGTKVTPRYLFCACDCHRTNPMAVPVPGVQDATDGEGRDQ